MKPEAGSQAELTYGAIFLLGVTVVSTGLALFPTYNKILGVALIAVGLVTVVAAALLVDCLAKRACRRRPPAYDAVASTEAGQVAPLTEPSPALRQDSDLSSGRSAPRSEQDPRDRLQPRRSTADEPWPERAYVGDPLPPAPDVSSEPAHPASTLAGKCAPRAPFCQPPSYDEVLAADLRRDSVASPESRILPADGGRMTPGRSSAPEIPPLSIGAAPMSR